jgi:hypothetical protein
MVAKKSRKPSKKVKSLPAKNVTGKQAKRVKGGSDFSFTHTYDKSSPVLFK